MRSWPKFGDNQDKYRDIKNRGEDFAAEITESLPTVNQQLKGKTKRCGNCGKFTKCGKTGFMELVNCSGWSPRLSSPV